MRHENNDQLEGPEIFGDLLLAGQPDDDVDDLLVDRRTERGVDELAQEGDEATTEPLVAGSQTEHLVDEEKHDADGNAVALIVDGGADATRIHRNRRRGSTRLQEGHARVFGFNLSYAQFPPTPRTCFAALLISSPTRTTPS